MWSQTWAPRFRQFDLTNKTVTLEYIERLATDDPGKAVFKAFAKEMNLTVTVKFTAKYNQDAYRRLAEAGLAPKLWFCERVADVGGLYVVVMDYVEHPPYSELDDITSLHDDYPGVIHSLRRAVQLFTKTTLFLAIYASRTYWSVVKEAMRVLCSLILTGAGKRARRDIHVVSIWIGRLSTGIGMCVGVGL